MLHLYFYLYAFSILFVLTCPQFLRTRACTPEWWLCGSLPRTQTQNTCNNSNIERIQEIEILMYSNAKVSSKLFLCVEYFLLYFDYCYIYSYYCCYYYHHYLYMCMEYFLMGQKKSVPSSFRFSREATM